MFNVRLSRLLALFSSVLLALGVGLASAPAATANTTFIATPNGMVGMEQEIVFREPGLAGQVATIGFVSGAVSNAGQTTVNAQGYGSLAWTPTSAGAWTISGLGNAASIGSTTINVSPMPTATNALVPNLIQTGVANNVTVAVTALDGIIAPTGTVVLRNQNENVLGSATLASAGGTTATANVTWTPSGSETVNASYLPSSTAFTASSGQSTQPRYTSDVVTVALRFPPVLYVGTPTIIGAQTGNGVPAGSASFFFDSQGIIGSTPTDSTGGISAIWTPTSAGVHTISTEFSSSNGAFSGTSSQSVNIQPAKTKDSITVTPAGGSPWNPGLPISLPAGSTTSLTANAASGATVVFGETGPCVINGSALTVLSAGQCTVTATSPGSASLTPVTNTYVVTVTKPPRRARR